MSLTTSDATNARQTDLTVATQSGGEIELRGTTRGKTHLSLNALESKVEHYPAEVRQATRAVHAYFVEHCDSDIEHLLGVAKNNLGFERSPEYFSNWIKGSYYKGGTGNLSASGKGYGDWMGFCERLIDFARITKTGGKTILTSTVRAIVTHAEQIFDMDNPCRIAGVAGPTGSQKTEAMKYIVAKRGGFPHATMINCTEGLGLTMFKRVLGDAFNCKVGNKTAVLDGEIRKNLNPQRALFIDNIQRAYRDTNEEHAIWEFLLRIQEDRNFPLFLSFTKDFKKNQLGKKVTEDGGFFLEQVVGRFGGFSEILELPDYTPESDLRTIAKAYGLADSAAETYLKPWSRASGRIRPLFKRLYRAKQFAAIDETDHITLDILKLVDGWVPPASLAAEDAA